MPDTGTLNPAGAAPTGAPSPSPSPAPSPAHISLTDDSMVLTPGAKDPTRFGDLLKRQQADYTRKTQTHAQTVKAFEAKQAAFENQRKAEVARLESLAASLVGRKGEPGNEFLTSLESKQYISGKDMATIMRAIHTQGFGAVKEAFAQRDEILTAMYQQLVSLNQAFGGLGSQQAEQTLQQKIAGWLKEADMPAEAARWATELYLAYEPTDELDGEFPEILKSRWEEVGGLHAGVRAKRLEAAKRAPFVPGKGGNGAAAKPAGLTGRENARETADYLWNVMQQREQT